jgi:serine/threonine protein phosphatase 1
MSDFIELNIRPSGKRYAISDIHGCFKTFRHLVEEVIQLSISDQLFLLGDYVDRGPSSQAVLDYILQLMEKGYQIFPLRGNHENDLLEYARGESRFLLWQLNKHNYPGIARDGRLSDRYFLFLDRLPYYYELNDCFLVHAGFDFGSEKPFENRTAMLWLKYFDPAEDQLNGKKVIHGHDPVYMDVIIEHIEMGRAAIPLDNGVCYTGKHKLYDTTQLGNLCALDLDTHELLIQQNIDM